MTAVKTGSYLQVHDYASREQCAVWTRTILERKPIWRRYSELIWTFGNSWYLDIERGEINYYHAMARHSNRLISELPGFLPAMIGTADFLPKVNGKKLPVRSRSKNLGPFWCDAGIHIMGGKLGRHRVGVAHADYEGLAPYPEKMFDRKTRAYSCILSLAAPASGGGLEVWDDQRRLGDELFIEGTFRSKDAVKLRYDVGTVTLLDSFLYHRLMDCTFTEKHPWRIAAVMHFLYRETPRPHWEHWF